MNANAALLVIDVQAGMFLESDPVHHANELLRNIGTLIEKARCSDTPVIYLQHNARPGKPLEPGKPGWEIHPAIRPETGDAIIQKTTPDSFHGTDLQQKLAERGIKKLVLTGIQTELCVDTTCRRAHSLGYNVTLAKDAHSTWNRGQLTARQIVEHHNSLLAWFASIEDCKNICF